MNYVILDENKFVLNYIMKVMFRLFEICGVSTLKIYFFSFRHFIRGPSNYLLVHVTW